jgi:hypothetical protein
VLFRTATEWVAALGDARRAGRLQEELARLQRIPLIVVDLGRHRDYAETVRGAIVNCGRAGAFGGARRARLSA